jgi:hypothetical protein
MNVTSLLKITNMTILCSFEAFSVRGVNQEIHAFWAVMPCSLVNSRSPFTSSGSPDPEDGTIPPKCQLTIYQMTWRNIPYDLNLHQYHYVNLITHGNRTLSAGLSQLIMAV